MSKRREKIPQPLPDFSDCPETYKGVSDGALLYGTFDQTLAGHPRVVFRVCRRSVPDEMLRTLWCCAHKRIEVTLNFGMCEYSPAHYLRYRDRKFMWLPWPSFTKSGWLYFGSEDYALWLGTCGRQETFTLENILAIRLSKRADYQPLWVAPQYNPPPMFLRDGKKPGEIELHYDGAILGTGRSRKFAENQAGKLGAQILDRRAAYLAQHAPPPRRCIRIRK